MSDEQAMRMEELGNDAVLALDTVQNGRSSVFRKAAAEWLRQIAAEMDGLLAAAIEDEREDEMEGILAKENEEAALGLNAGGAA